MFVLEISFQDGVSQPEMVFVRRPQALIGSSDYAHVVIEDMASLGYQLRLVKDIGRSFRCKAVGSPTGNAATLGDGSFSCSGEIHSGPVTIIATSLNTDLLMKEGEPPDRAGVRVLRQACSIIDYQFPAVMVGGSEPMVISFVSDQPVYLGRSNQCAVRLDSADVSAKHARMGVEGGNFWIEDLGSTNGTFIDGQQISGRVSVPPGKPIVLGRELSVIGVTSAEELQRGSNIDPEQIERPSSRRYPVLLSVSEVARPARVVLPIGGTLSIGRDPECDMWLGAPHISRIHCAVSYSESGTITVIDYSTNGTAFDGGVLKKGETLEIHNTPKVLNFGGDLTVALCFDGVQETSFLAAEGAPYVFAGKSAISTVDETTPGQSVMDTLMGEPSSTVSVELGDTVKDLFKSRWRTFLNSPHLTPTSKFLVTFALLVLVTSVVCIVFLFWQSGFK